MLDKTYAERPGVEGMKHVMSPPLREKRNQKALWDALNAGLIDTVGTDHCPFDTEQKLLGRDAFTQIPNGIPGIEERVNLLYTYGVKRGNLDIHRFVDAASTKAAKLFGLFPRKGTIAVGSDADLVIYDPDHRSVDLRAHPARQQRLQRLRRHGNRRASFRRHRARQSPGARWRLRRRSPPRQATPARATL